MSNLSLYRQNFLAKFCDPSMIHLLCHHGADLSILNLNEQSPLHIACSSNRLEIVEEICNLTRTSLLEIKDNYGRTALSVTTHSDIVNKLIEFGADISSLDHNHMNVLMTAVSTCQISIVNRLLLSINHQLQSIIDQIETKNERSIFLIAVQTGSIDICSLLLTHPYVRWDTVDKQRMNAFHIAAQNNYCDLIKFLCNYIQQLDKLISIQSRNHPLTPTTMDSDDVNIQQTISSILHLYIDAQDEDGKTPLHVASERGHLSSIEILLDYGANSLIVNDLGQLPLHVAIQNGYSQCVDLLIRYSIKDTNEFHSVLSKRQSPMITACQYGYADIVERLIFYDIGIDYGMNVHYDNEENPLEIAIKYRQIETIHVLLEHSHIEHWLLSKRNLHKNDYQTPLRDLIRYMPDCAQHAFDRLISKTNEIDFHGDKFERMVYKYKYIDDYFM